MAGQPKTRAKKRLEHRKFQNKEIKTYQDEVLQRSLSMIKQSKVGPPTIFTEELWFEFLNHIANGLSLRKIAEIDGMPGVTTVREWLIKDRELALQYARAREAQADTLADELLEIIDNVEAERDAVEKAKARVETRKWIAAKLKPKKYGDKLDLTSDGEALPTPITALQVNMPAGTQALPPGQTEQKS